MPAVASEMGAHVLIVGGGVVGLSASLFLSHHGIDSILVERHSSTSIHPRSRSVNARTMEFYRGLGITESVQAAAAAMSATMGMYCGESLREVIEALPRKDGPRRFPFAGLTDGISPEKGTFVTQDQLEPALLQVARDWGCDVRYHTECMSVEQDDAGVSAVLKDRLNEALTTVRAQYLIAADGASSPIRQRLGTKTTGRGSMGHLLNILFRANLRELVRGREFSLCYIDRPEVAGLMTSIDNDQTWVFHMSYDPSTGEKAADFSPEKCKEMVRLALDMPGTDIDIRSILPWEPSVRLAERLQHGRIFLAGDAAHQMPPWAGQGANSGIADVHNLAWKLAAVLRGEAGIDLLKTYDVERLPVVKVAAEASAAAAAKDKRGIICTKKDVSFVLGMLGRLPIMSGHGYRYSSESFSAEDTAPLGGLCWRPWTVPAVFLCMDGRPGSRVPHLWIQQNGKRISTLDLTGRGKGFVLLAGADGQAWTAAAKAVAVAVGVGIVAYCIGPECDLTAASGEWESAAGISAQGALLVRPDDFIVWRSRRKVEDHEAVLEAAMVTALCRH